MKPPVQLHDFASIALVAVGSNLPTDAGSPQETVISALKRAEVEGFTIRATSRLFRTPAFPAGSGPDFVNGCFAVETTWSPAQILEHLHDIERSFDRSRKERWAARTLDLDLLAYGAVVLPDHDTLKSWMELPLELQSQAVPKGILLPHPRLQERAFVLVPLADIALDWMHPILSKTVAEMHNALPDYLTQDVVPLS